MSTGTLQRAYLNTRLSILASRLLPRREIDSLLETGADEPAESGPERSAEQVQLTALLEDLRVVVRPLFGADRELLVHAVHLFELANLKTIIRGKLAGLERAAIEAQLLDLGAFATLPVGELLNTEDAAEALRRLEATSYHDIARQARRAFEEGSEMFAVDAAIDRHYMVGLRRRVESASRPERRAVAAIVGVWMDHTNLVWLLRYRFSYDFSPAATYYQLVPGRGLLTGERLRTLARLPELIDVIDALPNVLRRWVAGAGTIAATEDRLERRLEAVSDAALRKERHPVARAFAYFLRRDIEMRRMVAVIKGRRLGIDPALIRVAAHAAG